MHFTPVRCVNSNASLALARLQGPQRGQSCSVAPSLLPPNCNQFVLTTRSPTARLENCNRSICERDWFFTHSSVSDFNLSYFRNLEHKHHRGINSILNLQTPFRCRNRFFQIGISQPQCTSFWRHPRRSSGCRNMETSSPSPF